MQIINRPRGAGKTYTLVQWLLQDPTHRVIVTPTEEQARYLRQTYLLNIAQVISGNSDESVRAKLAHRSLRTQVAFDEAGDIIRRALQLYVGPKEIAFFTSSFDECVPDAAHRMTPLEQAEDLERQARAIRHFNNLPPLQPEPAVSPEVTRLIELGDQLGSAVRDFLNKK